MVVVLVVLVGTLGELWAQMTNLGSLVKDEVGSRGLRSDGWR